MSCGGGKSLWGKGGRHNNGGRGGVVVTGWVEDRHSDRAGRDHMVTGRGPHSNGAGGGDHIDGADGLRGYNTKIACTTGINTPLQP